MTVIAVSEFKAVCLRVLEDVRRTGEPLQITKNGKPLVVVHAAPAPVARSFGALKHTLSGPVGDLISPVVDSNEWEALR